MSGYIHIKPLFYPQNTSSKLFETEKTTPYTNNEYYLDIFYVCLRQVADQLHSLLLRDDNMSLLSSITYL